MILAILHLFISPKDLVRAIQMTDVLVRGTRAQPGCMGCRLLRDTESGNAMILVEEWASQADLDRYLRSGEYRRVQALMDLSGTPAELRFHRVAQKQGMEVIQRTRAPMHHSPE